MDIATSIAIRLMGCFSFPVDLVVDDVARSIEFATSEWFAAAIGHAGALAADGGRPPLRANISRAGLSVGARHARVPNLLGRPAC